MPLIGRESDADLVLPFPTVSARHAWIEAIGPSTFIVRDLNSANGTWVNDRRVSESPVTPADRIRCGSVAVEWSAVVDAVRREAATPGGLTVGREPGNDIVIDDPRLSARHARVIASGDRLTIVDLGSSNGVFINDVQVNRGAIAPGDRVRFGSMHIGLFPLLSARGFIGGEARAATLVPVTRTRPAEASAVTLADEPAVRPAVAPRRRLRIHDVDRRIWITAAAIVLIAAVAGWYALALRRFDAMTVQARQLAGSLETARGALFSSDLQPADAIPYAALQAYVQAVEGRSAEARALVRGIAEGHGMAFWLPSRRRAVATELDAALAREGSLASDARAALTATEAGHAATASAIEGSRRARDVAGRALSPETDIDGFGAAAAELRQSSGQFEQAAAAARATLQRENLSGRPEAIRAAVVRSIHADLVRETRLAEARGAALAAGADELAAYKERLAGTLRQADGVVSVVASLSSGVAPAVDWAYRQSEPLRELLSDAEQPLPGGTAAGIAGRLFGVSQSAEAVSPLSIAAGISPHARAAVGTLQAVCSAIETAQNEVRSALSTIGPLSATIDSFQSDRARGSMLAVVTAAPPAAEYFRAHQPAFDPLIAKLEEAREPLASLHSAAASAPPLARGILWRLAGSGSAVLDRVEAPFRNARALMGELAAGLSQLGAEESAYRSRLEALKTSEATHTDSRIEVVAAPAAGGRP